MNRIIKYALFAFAALSAGLLLLVGYVAITVDPNDYKPQIVRFVRDETNRDLKLEGKIGLKLFPRIGLNLGGTQLSGPGGKGEFASVDNVILDLAWLPLLHGKMEIDRVDIDGLHAHFVRYQDGTTNYGDLTGGKGGKTEYDIGSIEVRNSSVSYEDDGTGRKTRLEKISLRTGRLGEGVHSDISIGFDMDDEGPAHFGFRSGLLIGPQSYRFDGIELKYEKGKFVLSASGNAEIEAAAQKISADLASSFDESHVQTKFSMSNFSSPSYRFDVGIDRLDADRYLSSGAKKAEKPFDLSFLKKLDAQGRILISSLKIHGLRISDFKVGIKAADARLDLDPLSAVLYQGKANGSASVTAASTPKFTLRQNLSGISIGPLIRDMTKKDIIEGRGDVSADLSAKGSLFGELKKTLGGRVSLHLFDGSVRGIDIAAKLRGIKSRAGGIETGVATSSEKTDFSELSA
ncbi:MAG TPA: AsmA family protein, partial [Burkholderiales bacterium]|nr:AsmA family protein [Burkholderiales bacterium]